MDVYDGAGWVEVAYWTDGQGDDELWKLWSIDVTPYLNPTFRVRFTSHTNRAWEETEVDDVLVTGTRRPRSGCGLGSALPALVALGVVSRRRRRRP